MTFLSQAQSLFAKGDREGLTAFIRHEQEARERGWSQTPALDFNKAFDMEAELKRKERRAS